MVNHAEIISEDGDYRDDGNNEMFTKNDVQFSYSRMKVIPMKILSCVSIVLGILIMSIHVSQQKKICYV